MHVASTSLTHSLASTSIPTLIAHPPIDAVIIFVFFLMILIDAIRSDSGRAATLVVALPLTLFFATIIQKAAIVGPMIASVSAPLPQAGIIGVIFAVIAFLTYRVMYTMGGLGISPFIAVVASLAATITLIVSWLMVPALQSIWHFSPFIHAAFGDPYAFWWLISAFLLMAFVRS